MSKAELARTGLSEEQLHDLTTIAMRAFEPMSTVLRYREAEKWHTCDKIGMRHAVIAVAAALRALAQKEKGK